MFEMSVKYFNVKKFGRNDTEMKENSKNVRNERQMNEVFRN